jgi:nucleotide-binding universal stress UspA family protein
MGAIPSHERRASGDNHWDCLGTTLLEEGRNAMYKHLLVTLDGTARSEAVIPHALSVARSMGAEVTLLRVVDAVAADWSERGAIGKSQAESTIRSLFADQAQSYLERVATEMGRDGVTVHTLVKQGPPAKQIITSAREVEADAIAMATHSRRGLNRLMFGSVAEQVLHETSLPIILVRAA